MTLFRATRDEVLTNGSDGGQMLGAQIFSRPQTLPLKGGYLKLREDRLVISAVKSSEDEEGTYIVRLFNVEKHEVTDTLQFALPVKTSTYVNLNEDDIQPIPVGADGNVNVVTIRLSFADRDAPFQTIHESEAEV